MRWLALLTLPLAWACSGPKAANLLAADAAAFCRAAQVLGAPPSGLAAIGPYFEREFKGAEFKQLTADLKQGAVPMAQFHAQAALLVQRAGIADCPTLAWFEPSKKPEG